DLSSALRWMDRYSMYEPRPYPRVAQLPQPKPYIVVVEKEDILSRQLGALLGDVEVVRFCDEAELAANLSEAPPNIILVNDIRVMRNDDLLRILTGLHARVPIVGCYIPGSQEAREQLNVVDHLVKPVTLSELLTAAQKVVPEGGNILIVEDNRQ